MAPILVVDDDDDIRDSVADLLCAEGYEVTTAKNGAEALTTAAHNRPAVILLDLAMPEVDGWKFRERQLADAQLARIPVVIMSAIDKVQRETAELHISEYLIKPINLSALLDVVKRYAQP